MRSNTDCCTPMFQTGQVEFGGFIKVRFFGVPIGIVVFWGRCITIPKGSLNPLFNHSYEDIANVKNKAGNEPITKEFMEQFN